MDTLPLIGKAFTSSYLGDESTPREMAKIVSKLKQIWRKIVCGSAGFVESITV